MWGSIIGAVIGGVASFVDHIVSRYEEHDELKDALKNLDTQYNDKKDELKNQYDQNVENANAEYENSKAAKELEIKQAKDQAKHSYDKGVKNTTLTFETEKKEAYHKAKVSDDAETFNEWVYSQELNRQLGLLGKEQQLMAYSFNQANMQKGRSEGEALSSMASSGTRGSSMSQALELDSANNAMQLQLAQDKSRNELGSQYQSTLLASAQNNFRIQQTRDANNWTRNSYLEGGSNYNLYQNALGDLLNDYNFNVDQITEKGNLYFTQLQANRNRYLTQLKDTYNVNLKSLTNTYNMNKDKLQKKLDDNEDDFKQGLIGFGKLLSGGAAGWQTGSNVQNTVENYFA